MRRFALTLAPLLLLACDRAPVAPVAGPNVEPTFNIANAPLESGIVVRAGWPVAGYRLDPETQLGLAIGMGAKEICSGASFYSFLTWADKLLRDRLVTIGQGTDIPTEVWDASLGLDCPSIMAGEPLATGVSQNVSTINNLAGLSDRVPRIQTWTAHGILTRQNGEKAIFHWRFRFRGNQDLLDDLVTLH
jgi:hypothetical protein